MLSWLLLRALSTTGGVAKEVVGVVGAWFSAVIVIDGGSVLLSQHELNVGCSSQFTGNYGTFCS